MDLRLYIVPSFFVGSGAGTYSLYLDILMPDGSIKTSAAMEYVVSE
jgi:hypothetical protein